MSDLYMSDNISYKDVQNTISKVMDKAYRDGYNKAIDDFAKAIQPYITQYRSALEHNRYAFIDMNNIAEQLKTGKKNEGYKATDYI